MTEEKEKGLHITAGGGVAKPQNPTPKAIAAQSQARNSFARIIILGMCLLALFILIGIAMFARPEYVKDLLWAAIAVTAYLAGSTEANRKEEK